ncbi:glutathione peroxidase [Mucilaginibacter sp. UR6-11]|uniref:glutathione peroxidase n=1 Tax=Mucilaginibacter sp. UR6-11 TaxID=1435644 RepID=UPI001E641712|nr:glutathione peroxidase [Mucilaginibacter sp. UR6-11]MCC8423856.1 glutathione peroxidase [Mucilaginibacter sp. UR6-11]
MSTNSIYQFNVQKISGQEISLSDYKNKVLLIVNTASECGFTPQLKDLAALKNEFAGQDFEILSFPSNDFGGQEPLEGDAIAAFCENYGANFPIFEKIRVRGPYADPLYKFFADKKQNGRLSSVPRWNFHKFLIDRNGEVTDFYYPFTNPTSSKIKKKISRLLAAGH